MTMTNTEQVARVKRATAARTRAEGAADRAAAAQAEAIRAALADGARVVDLVAATGLSRERIYQIRDNRR